MISQLAKNALEAIRRRAPFYTTFDKREVLLCRDSPEMLGAEAVRRIECGPRVTLWRQYRDGHETRTVLPEYVAEVELHAIPETEPDVARARLER